MPIATAFIVPAMTDQAGQCRIVAALGHVPDPLSAYRADPEPWFEVGTMTSRGNLACCERIGTLEEQLISCGPLSAGLVIYFNAPTASLLR